ncbi:BTAD domain-containing putative transcriptional regulator [Saccharopolyspora hirsuta]|nr:BTAD domain-containing putative transcriptional regulator [Saccharopolyspora hirsuta]
MMAPHDRSSGAPVAGFEFRVLGPLEVLVDGVARPVGSSQVRALLTCLLLEPNQVVSMDRLIDTIWEHDPPASARTIIQGYVSRLRKLFAEGEPGGPEIVTRPPGYLLRVDAERIDAHRARALINRAHGLDPAERSRVLAEALTLWRGPVLSDISSSRLYQMVAPNLDELRLLALEERIDADLDLGRHHQLLLELSTLVDRHPLRERLTGQLMLASYRAGHRAEAQARFHELRRRLSDELGLDPGPDLRDLYEQVLRDDPALRSARRPEPALGIKRPIPAELPPAPAGFVGRRRELGELDRLLAERERGSTLLAVLTGIAGVGKSALALTWAHRVEQEFPDGQLYASLRGYHSEREPLSPGEALTSMLKALGVAADAIPVELDDRAALYRSLLAKRRVLVLLDNARDSDQVRPLLPGSAESMVLVTSRRRLDGLVVRSGATVLPLETLPTESAIELLDRAGVPGKSASEPVAAAELADLCGGLPLALRIAAARLAANPARGVSDLVHELTDERNRLHALDIDDDADTSVRRAFDISYRSLHPVHAETFRLLGLVPGHTFTADAVAALCDTDPASAQRRLRALALAHLVVEPEPDRFGMHDLLRVYARDLLAESDDPGALRRLLNHYLVIADHARRFLRPTRDELNFAGDTPHPEINDRAQALDWFDAEWPNLVAAVRAANARGMHDLAWQLARLQFNYLMVRCPWEDWIRVYTDGLDSARAIDDPTGKVLMSAGLGVAHSRSGQLDEALAHYDESYRVAVANDDASRRAMTQINMASVLFRLKRYDEAKAHCQDALRVYRSLGDRYFEAGALNNLAMVEQVNGEREEALAHLREAEALYRAADDLDTLAMVLNNCGEVCIELGRLDDGERYHHEALDVALKCGSAMRQASAHLGLGDAARCRGDLAVTRTRWETALAIFEAEGSPRASEARERLEGLAKPA